MALMRSQTCLTAVRLLVILCAIGACPGTYHSGVVSNTSVAVFPREPHEGSDSVVCGRRASDHWIITPQAVGPVGLSDTFERLRALCPGARDTVDLLLGKFARLVLPGFGGKTWVEPPFALHYGADALHGRIGRILVETRSVRTREGVGGWGTLSDLRTPLGSMLVVPSSDVGDFVVPRAD